MNRRPLLVLFSGGLDSTVLLAWALRHGPVATLGFDWPGRPPGERRAEARVLSHYAVRHRYRQALPRPVQDWVQGNPGRGYLPGRNAYFYATAALLARRIGAAVIAGAHLRGDGREFADARRSYLEALEDVFNRGRRSGEPRLRIATPLLHFEKDDVVRVGRRWNAPLELTWSCYRNGARPCGRCSGCRERTRAFKAADRPRRRAPTRASRPATD